MTVQRISLSQTRNGPDYRQATGGATALQVAPSPVSENIDQQQVIASSSVTSTISIPALEATSYTVDIPFSIPLGLPSFSLAKGASGLISAMIDVAAHPQNAFIVFSKQIAYGNVPGANVWTISAGTRFNGARLVGVARVIATNTANAQEVTVVVQSWAFGTPAAMR